MNSYRASGGPQAPHLSSANNNTAPFDMLDTMKRLSLIAMLSGSLPCTCEAASGLLRKDGSTEAGMSECQGFASLQKSRPLERRYPMGPQENFWSIRRIAERIQAEL